MENVNGISPIYSEELIECFFMQIDNLRLAAHENEA